MNGAYIHLLFNHVPILGSVFALCLVLYGTFFRNTSILKAGLVTLVVSALFSIIVFVSGEEAEHLVENIIGVSHDAIETHEEQGAIAFWSMIMSGAVALGALLSSLKTNRVSSPLQWITIITLIITVILMVRAGHSGGEIRHTEIHATGSTGHDHD
jgi:uncharacterized membrane protein